MDDTDVLTQGDAEPIALVKEPNAEPIPGYRLLEPLGSGGFGEVWKCEAPGGLTKAIKFVFGNLSSIDDTAPAEEELRALQLVKAIRHPFLLSLERVEVINGELVIVMELADRSLHDVLTEYHKAGLPGLPRDRLLGYLREAAEALDVMNLQHGLQHLDVKPNNLFLVGGHIKVADFGLVNSRSGPSSTHPLVLKLGSLTPLYTSPEVFAGTLSPHSDQYSLAITYQQLLTGTLPFNGQNARQLLMQHICAEPDLGPLPPADQPTVARALSKDPSQRYPSCADFIRALIEGEGALATPSGEGAAVHCVGLPDYRFLECLACSPLAEAWKAQAPDGRLRLVQFVYGFSPPPLPASPSWGEGIGGEWQAILRFKALRHPSLMPVEVVQCEPGRLVLLTDLAEKSLHDRLRECRMRGLPGVPRAEVLNYLRVAAETLETVQREHGVLHLGLNPRSMLLSNGRLLLADMGLAHLLWGPATQPLAQLNEPFSAPELYEGKSDAASDQYSLAAIYQELLTGIHPFGGPGGRPGGKPNLDPPPEGDREIIARALDSDPRRRWSSCPELVLALTAAGGRLAGEAPKTAPVVSQWGALSMALPGSGRLRQQALPEVLRRRYKVLLPPGVIRPRLDAFRLQWHGQVVRDELEQLVFHVNLPRSFWQRWFGRQSGLEVVINLVRKEASAPTEVTVQLRPFGCGREHGPRLVKDLGTLLLESLRTYLQVNPERRIQERLIWPHPLLVRAVEGTGVGDPVEGQGKDISPSGIGFYLPYQLPGSRIHLELPCPGQSPVQLNANIARIHRCGESWLEVGALFEATDEQQKTILGLCAR